MSRSMRPAAAYCGQSLPSSSLNRERGGQLRLEASRGHDDLVIATALAVLAADIEASRTSKLFEATLSLEGRDSLALPCLHLQRAPLRSLLCAE